MKSKRTIAKGRKINPHFWVFCEGKTEEAYVRFLRSKYRLPVEIIPKVAGSDIDNKYIGKYKRGKLTHQKDKTFLIYDANVDRMVSRLKLVTDVNLILSNPSVELWFLLHYKNQTINITEEGCIRELNNRNKSLYKKGLLDEKLKAVLSKNYPEACTRSRRLSHPGNPSSNMYMLIDELDTVKKKKEK